MEVVTALIGCNIAGAVGRVRLVCLVVICVIQNDRGLLRASAVTRGWNRCGNVSTPEDDPGEEHSPTAPAGTQQATIQSRVRRPTADLFRCYIRTKVYVQTLRLV